MENKQQTTDIISELNKAYNALLDLCNTQASQLRPEDQKSIQDVATRFMSIMSACDRYTTKWGKMFAKVRAFLEAVEDEKDDAIKNLFHGEICKLLRTAKPNEELPLVQMEMELEDLLRQFSAVTEATANLGMVLKPFNYDTTRNYVSIGLGALGVAVGVALMATAWTGIGPFAAAATVTLGVSLIKRGAENLTTEARKKQLLAEVNNAIKETNTIKEKLRDLFAAVDAHAKDIAILKDLQDNLPIFKLSFVKNACDSFEKLQSCVRGFLLQPQPELTPPSESTPLLSAHAAGAHAAGANAAGANAAGANAAGANAGPCCPCCPCCQQLCSIL